MIIDPATEHLPDGSSDTGYEARASDKKHFRDVVAVVPSFSGIGQGPVYGGVDCLEKAVLLEQILKGGSGIVCLRGLHRYRGRRQ